MVVYFRSWCLHHGGIPQDQPGGRLLHELDQVTGTPPSLSVGVRHQKRVHVSTEARKHVQHQPKFTATKTRKHPWIGSQYKVTKAKDGMTHTRRRYGDQQNCCSADLADSRVGCGRYFLCQYTGRHGTDAGHRHGALGMEQARGSRHGRGTGQARTGHALIARHTQRTVEKAVAPNPSGTSFIL